MLNKSCAGCGESGVELCRRCRFALIASPSFRTPEGVVAAAAFSGMAKQLVVGLKYRNRRGLAKVLAEQLSRQLNASDVDVITWAPTSRQRAARRGYDQSELVARALARRWRKPCQRLLFRSHGVAQTGRSRVDRLQGPTFQARPMRHPARVLVIDDVVTTGSTLQAARRALLDSGARSVALASVAATPDHIQPVGRFQSAAKPASAAISARAGALSTSTTTPNKPRLVAACTFDGRSSANAVRPATALSLVKAS
jgi:ComF family protein